jgi:hypothetical protein
MGRKERAALWGRLGTGANGRAPSLTLVTLHDANMKWFGVRAT